MVNTRHNFMDTRWIRTSIFCMANMALQPLVHASTLGFISHEQNFPSGMRVEFLLKTESGYLRDAEVT